MHDSAHRVRVLTAIIDDAAATPGEIAAARAALAVHAARCGVTTKAASGPAPAAAPARQPAAPRDVLLVYQDGWWTLVVDGAIINAWRGDGEIIFDRREYEFSREEFGSVYVSSGPQLVHIHARVADLAFVAFDDELRHGPVRIVIETNVNAWGPTTWLFDARYESSDMSWDAHHVHYPARSSGRAAWCAYDADDSHAWTTFKFIGIRHSTLFETASVAATTLALAEPRKALRR